MLEDIASWWPLALVLLLGGLAGAYLDIGEIVRRRRVGAIKRDVKLQYTRVEPIVAERLPGHAVAVEVRVWLDNPNEQNLRLEPEYLRTTFESRADDHIPKSSQTRDLTAGSRGIVVHGQTISLGPRPRYQVIHGRLDWAIRYGAIVDGEEPDLKHFLIIRGDIEIHYMNGIWMSRWAPDQGTPTPALEVDRIEAIDERGDIWSR